MVGHARSETRGRPGHSLPELLVALTFLGASLAAMASVSVLASRWTGEAVSRQRALAAVEAVLDSLTTLPEPPLDGSAVVDHDTMAWVVDSTGVGQARLVEVTAVGPGVGPAPVRLRGLWIPPLPGPLP